MVGREPGFAFEMHVSKLPQCDQIAHGRRCTAPARALVRSRHGDLLALCHDCAGDRAVVSVLVERQGEAA
jgi:hypothetical protein